MEYLKPLSEHGRYLEVGTGMAHSALYISALKPFWNIYTIDSFGLAGDGRIYDGYEPGKVKAIFDALEGRAIQILGDSTKITNWELPLDALFIDGGHYYETVKQDFQNFATHLKSGCYLFMHDYHREDFGVKQVVEEAVESGLYELVFANKVAVLLKK